MDSSGTPSETDGLDRLLQAVGDAADAKERAGAGGEDPVLRRRLEEIRRLPGPIGSIADARFGRRRRMPATTIVGLLAAGVALVASYLATGGWGARQRRALAGRIAAVQADERTVLEVEAARAMNDRHHVDAILAEWRPAVLDVPASAEAAVNHWMGLLAYRTGVQAFLSRRYDMAEAALARARELLGAAGMAAPAELEMLSANIAKERGEWALACRRLRRMTAPDAGYRLADIRRGCNLLAYCLARQADPPGDRSARAALLAEAERAVARAIDAPGPPYAKAYVQRAILYRMQGHPDRADRALHEGLAVAERKRRQHPDDPRLWFTTAIIAARLGQRDAALAALREAVAREHRGFPISNDFWPSTEPAFASLREDPEFRDILTGGKFAAGFLASSPAVWDEPLEAEARPDPPSTAPGE